MTDLSSYSDEDLMRAIGSTPADFSPSMQNNSPAAPTQNPAANISDEALMNIVKGANQPQQPEESFTRPSLGDYASDVGKSVVARGIPEGLAATTVGGYGLNVVHGISELGRLAARGLYKKLEGEDYISYKPNPIPTSSDVLNALVKQATGDTLYEPKTKPGEFANTAAQFGTGAGVLGQSIKTGIRAGLVSEAAGQATRGTDWEAPARIAGALVGGGGLPSRTGGETPQLSAQDVRSDASQLYKTAQEAGGVLSPETTNKWIDTAKNILPQTEGGKAVLGETAASKLAGRLEVLRDKPLDLQTAQEIDSSLGELASEQVHPTTGKLNAQGTKISEIQRSLRDTIENASSEDIAGGKQGFDTWKDARSVWAKSARMAEIEKIINKADGADNPTTILKNGFRTLANNPSRLRGFSEDEMASIKEAAKTGVLGSALKFAGSRLISSVVGGIAGAAGGGPLGSAAGAIAGGLVGTPARAAAEALQRQRANRVLNTILQGKRPQTKFPLLKALRDVNVSTSNPALVPDSAYLNKLPSFTHLYNYEQ